ncbi:urease accessory protein [Limimaricola soesokkakensis]|uniref:Urease accessory protein UreF n=2 Tax=Limimaricola soesokkakensis TaxID=1343159 RepID=A0A1X7A241_9RHOB|nr:urease accessory protein [Limimaricola soesokkakensis]SLN66393.1 Urease accessory protein UreF [Limimaricola soesokkakensis]
MVTVAPTRMNMSRRPMLTELQALTLARWLSPGYPVGAFAYSHGLEQAIADGRVLDCATLEDWLRDTLEFGAGRNDALLLVAAWRADEADLTGIDATARALAASRERVIETERQGTAFARTEAQVSGVAATPLAYPVAIGAAASRHGLPLRSTCALYLQAFAANLVSAAQRLMPLGQTEGQQLQSALAPLCARIAEEVEHGTLDDLSSTTFMGDIASMRHETQQPRIFAT